MAGGSIELALRQILYESVSSGDMRQARKVFWEWFAIVGIIGTLGILGLSVLHKEIAFLVLAEGYREGAYLMPWIGIGYGLLLLAQVLERVCYATKDTGSVLFIQSAGAILSIPISVVGVLWFGVAGAAAAVPCYFGLQFAIALICACRAARTHTGRTPHDPAVAGSESGAN
jgi:O-antigen/teichoic acid export membrane protein